jgi:peptidoglycan/LPS O-acetylase OafA/YrhL
MMDDGRNFGLDGLRAAAIVSVVAAHAMILFWPGVAYEAAVVLGGMGVMWFFVLSGYLIGGLALRAVVRQRARRAGWLGALWFRLWFRTLPNYYLFLGVNLVLVWVSLETGPFHWEYLVFAQNLTGHAPPFFNESWFLAVVEMFYLVFPLLLAGALLLFPEKPVPGFLAAAVALAAIPVLARLTLSWTVKPDWGASFDTIAPLRLDTPAFGILAALWHRQRRETWRASRLWLLGPGIACNLVGAAVWYADALSATGRLARSGWVAQAIASNVPLLLVGVGTACVLPALVELRRPRCRAAAAVTRISIWSYAWYLCHLPVVVVLQGVMARLPAWQAAGAAARAVIWIGLSLGTAALVYRGYESRMTALREHVAPRVPPSA